MYNAFIDGLMKGSNPEKAIEIFQRMKRDCCQPNTETYTMMINLYGKVDKSNKGYNVKVQVAKISK